MKILFLGNSITKHSPSPDIGWYGDWGMAASCEENDYVHLTVKELKKYYPDTEFIYRNIADFERNYINYGLYNLEDCKSFGADIIIMRIIENVPRENNYAGFQEAYIKLIEFVKKDNSLVICSGSFWENKLGDEIIKNVAEQKGYTFVSLQSLQNDPGCKATKQFKHEGVAAHPSDKGMEGIANILSEAIKLKM
jgi:hypothetical protein